MFLPFLLIPVFLIPACISKSIILHVGPHKTGTTSAQNDLGLGEKWLRKAGVVQVASQKGGAYFANTLGHLTGQRSNEAWVSMEHFNRTLKTIRGSERVILSAEHLSRMNNEGWSMLERLLPGWNFTFVVVHRRPTAHMVSWFAQTQKNKDRIPPLLSLFSNRLQPLAILDSLDAVTAGNVIGVSYDTLKEENVTLASFLVCNVTLTNMDFAGCYKKWTNTVSNPNYANRSPSLKAMQIMKLCNVVAFLDNRSRHVKWKQQS